ncbi:MAG: hypothetical protein V3U69_04590, partial [Bacteroidota bacterium]
MNYGEEITYWYLRLNGFFPITNFVVHQSQNIRHSSDIDLLAIRTSHVYEEIGGKPDDWDQELAEQVGFQRNLGVICEVKTGGYDLDRLFPEQHIQYSVGRLGLVPRVDIPHVSNELVQQPLVELPDGNAIFKLFVADKETATKKFLFRTLSFIEDFLTTRVRRY